MAVPAARRDVNILVIEEHPGVGAPGRGSPDFGSCCVKSPVGDRPMESSSETTVEAQWAGQPDRPNRHPAVDIARHIVADSGACG